MNTIIRHQRQTLGCAICETHSCPCRCVVMVDPLGQHALSCKKQSFQAMLGSTTWFTAPSSGQKHQPSRSRRVSAATTETPDGLTLMPWQSGRSATWDVTVAHTLATAYVSQNALLTSFIEAIALTTAPDHQLKLVQVQLAWPSIASHPTVKQNCHCVSTAWLTTDDGGRHSEVHWDSDVLIPPVANGKGWQSLLVSDIANLLPYSIRNWNTAEPRYTAILSPADRQTDSTPSGRHWTNSPYAWSKFNKPNKIRRRTK